MDVAFSLALFCMCVHIERCNINSNLLYSFAYFAMCSCCNLKVSAPLNLAEELWLPLTSPCNIVKGSTWTLQRDVEFRWVFHVPDPPVSEHFGVRWGKGWSVALYPTSFNTLCVYCLYFQAWLKLFYSRLTFHDRFASDSSSEVPCTCFSCLDKVSLFLSAFSCLFSERYFPILGPIGD